MVDDSHFWLKFCNDDLPKGFQSLDHMEIEFNIIIDMTFC